MNATSSTERKERKKMEKKKEERRGERRAGGKKSDLPLGQQSRGGEHTSEGRSTSQLASSRPQSLHS